MIDDMGAHHVLQTTRNPPVNAPRIRRSKNGFRASMALCPRVPGLHIAKSCSGSPHPARPTTRIRAHRKRLQRLSRHSDTSDCSERLAKKGRSDPEQCSNFIEPRLPGAPCIQVCRQAPGNLFVKGNAAFQHAVKIAHVPVWIMYYSVIFKGPDATIPASAA